MQADLAHLSQYLSALWFELPAGELAGVSDSLRAVGSEFAGSAPLALLTSHRYLEALCRQDGPGNSVLRLLGSPFPMKMASLLSKSQPQLLDPQLRTGGEAPISQDLSRLTLGDTLRDPRLSPIMETIDQVWERYRRETRAMVRQGLQDVIAYVGGCGEVMTAEDFEEVRQRLLRVEKCVEETASLIGSLLEGLLEGAKEQGIVLLSEFKSEIWRLILFLTHDIAHFLPHELWRVPYAMRGGRESDLRLARLSTQTLKQVFAPQHLETLLQYVSFPVGIIPELYRLSSGKAIDTATVNLHEALTVVSGMVFQRMIMIYFLERFTEQRSGIQPGPQFSIGTDEDVAPEAEGFFLRGDPLLTVRTYPCAFFSILYNSIKNTFFAIHERYDAEDPHPYDSGGGSREEAAAWKARQETLIRKTKIRLVADVRTQWGRSRLDNVAWLRVGDVAGGFPLNRIWQLAHSKLTQHLREIFSLADADARLLRRMTTGLRLDEFQDVVDQLQRQLGLRDRSLVERLMQSYLNPHRVNLFTIQDTMELAAVFTLSGSVSKNAMHSGFGLYGIKILAPSSGLHYLHYTIPDEGELGTETVIAVQSLGGFMHAESTVRGMVESGFAA